MKMKWISVILAVLLLTGCAVTEDRQDTLPSFAPDPMEEIPSQTLGPKTYTVTLLYEDLFVPLAQGKLPNSLESLQITAQEMGTACIEEAGVALIYDPEREGCYARADLEYREDGVWLTSILYCLDVGAVQRQVEARNLGGTITLHVDVSPYEDGRQVESMEQVFDYLTAPLSEEDTAPTDPATVLNLFELLFLPVAQETEPVTEEEILQLAQEQGFVCQQGEGYLVFQDLEHPENYVYSSSDFYNGNLYIMEWGYRMTSGQEEFGVTVFFYGGGIVLYYVEEGYERRECTCVDHLKEYIYRSRF